MDYKKIYWVSDNGKYKVLVRHFPGDPSPLVGYWVLQQNGKYGPVRHKNLPKYVLKKIVEMKSRIMI